MGGGRKGAAWRRPFLRALGRTGNVRMAAAAAGVDHSTAYALRKRDRRFAGAWERALERARDCVGERFGPSAKLRIGFGQDERRDRDGSRGLPLHHPSDGPPPHAAAPHREDSRVVRVSKKHGPQVVRAAEGRWSEEKEKAFFQALFDTGNVRAAAAAVETSTTAIYNRRRTSEPFAEAWAAVLSESKVQLEMNMLGAVNRALDSIDPAEPPQITMRDAVAVFTACREGSGPGRGGPHGRHVPRIASNAEVRESLVKSLKAFGVRVTREEAEGRSPDSPPAPEQH